MIDVAAYHVLFPVQGGMWTGHGQSTSIIIMKYYNFNTWL